MTNSLKKKLKIGIFTDTYSPQINGVVSSIKIFRQELERLGHRVFVYAPKASQYKKITAQEKDVIRFESFRLYFQPEYNLSVPLSVDFLKNFFRIKLDIIHAHTPFSLGLLAFYYAVLKRKPLVHTYHTLYPDYASTYIFRNRISPQRLVAKISAIFCNRCDLNIAPSPKVKRLLIKYGVKTPIEVLPTGIDIGQFKKMPSDFRHHYKIKPQAKVLLFVGRLGREKNIEFLLKTLSLLVQNNTNYVLVIVGGGPNEKKLKALAQSLKITDHIIFTGYLPSEWVIKAYNAADLFVFSSLTETQGMVILEASACGLPIVAVRDDAFVNILVDGQNGYFTEDNIKQFAETVMKTLANKKNYRKMRVAAVKIARQFSIERQTQKLLLLYKALMK